MTTTRLRRLTIAAGAVAIPAMAASGALAAGTTTVTCRGGDTSCTATVGLSGGAGNRTLVVRLPDTDFRLQGRSVTPASVRGAYSLTNARFRLGGSEWVATLNAVQSIPRGARLTLRFGRPEQRTRTFGLFTRTTSTAYADLGPVGRGVGDLLTFTSDLYEQRNRPPVGTSYIDAVVVHPASGGQGEVRLYRQVFDFGADGILVVQGTNVARPPELALVPDTPSVRAIVGGTGDYLGARGQVTTTRLGTSDWYRQTVVLVSP